MFLSYAQSAVMTIAIAMKPAIPVAPIELMPEIKHTAAAYRKAFFKKI